MTYVYPEQELEASLKRAFVDGKADYVVICSRRDRFLLESAMFGVLNNWLSEELKELDEQSSELRFRLTEEGKKHFGVKEGVK